MILDLNPQDPNECKIGIREDQRLTQDIQAGESNGRCRICLHLR